MKKDLTNAFTWLVAMPLISTAFYWAIINLLDFLTK